MNKSLKRILKITSISIAVLIIFYFVFRGSLLNWGIGKVKEKIKDKNGAELTIRQAAFSGLATVQFEDLCLAPAQGDTLFTADSMSIRFSVWTLLYATIRIKELHASGVNIFLSCSDSICNYSSFLRNKEKSSGTGEKNYSLFFKRLLDKVFNLAPQLAELHRISVRLKKDKMDNSILITEFHSDENTMGGSLIDQSSKAIWQCNGSFSQSKRTLMLNIFPSAGTNQLPFINDLTGLSVGFDTLHMGLNGYKLSGNELTVEGNFFVREFSAFHKRISDDSVQVTSASIDFKILSGKNYLQLDSTSIVMLEAIKFNPFLRYESDSSKNYTLKIKTNETASNDLFASLPRGIFDEVRGISAEGTLQFNLDFNLAASHPEDVTFNVSLQKKKFRLKRTGAIDILKLNEEFTQNVYENGRFIRSFFVGPSNPYFAPFETISPNFVNAVLTSEDGNFFYHNGFNEDAFRKSIAANFKAGKFVRGGSTITMQLVKNVFLTRKKTIARKAEEALLVWLIESNNLCSKQRMLEVYLNIIELGPDVYGIGEASQFYFKKKPSEISLPEGIFLASLLPHPKWFKYSFDTLGNLKPHMADYYRIVSDFMLKKELITQTEHDSLTPHIQLTGPAREMVLPNDTIPEEEDEREL